MVGRPTTGAASNIIPNLAHVSGPQRVVPEIDLHRPGPSDFEATGGLSSGLSGPNAGDAGVDRVDDSGDVGCLPQDPKHVDGRLSYRMPSLPFDGEARPAREAELPHDGVGTPFGSGRSSPIGDGEKARYEHQQDGRECECSGQSLDAEIGHRKRSSRLVGYRGQPSSTQAPAARGSAKSAAA